VNLVTIGKHRALTRRRK